MEYSKNRRGSVVLTETDDGEYDISGIATNGIQIPNVVSNISSWDEGMNIIFMISDGLDPEDIARALDKPVFAICKNITAWDKSEVVDFRMARQDGLKCSTILRHMEDGSWTRVYAGTAIWKPFRDEYFTSTIDANIDIITKAIALTPDNGESPLWIGRPVW